MASRDGAMVMCEDKWASLANDHRALKMLHTLRDGGTIMEAYREAGYVGGDYRAVVKFYELAKVYPVFNQYAGRDQRRKLLRVLVTEKVIQQLESSDWKERAQGVVSARAISGLDAPTKIEQKVENVDLDKRPLVSSREWLNLNSGN